MSKIYTIDREFIRNPSQIAVGMTRAVWQGGGSQMLMTIFVLLIVLWLLGMVSSYTLGGFIHLLLVLAIATVLIRIIQGRRPV
jgi:hypothetical protein